MSRSSQQSSRPPKSSAAFMKVVCSGVLGALVFSFIDTAVGFSLPGPVLDGASETLAVVAAIGSRAIIIGLILGLAMGGWSLLSRCTTRAGSRDPALWVLAGVLGVGFVLINRDTFEGGNISAHSYITWIIWGFRIIGIVGIFIALVAARWLIEKAQNSAVTHTAIAVLSTLLVGVLLYQNAHLLVGLYPMLHTQLSAVAAMVSGAFVGTALARHSRLRWSLCGLALVIACCGVATRQMDLYRRVASAIHVRGPGTAELSFLSDPILDCLLPLSESEHVVFDQELGGTDEEAVEAAQTWLNEQLPNRRSMNLLMIAVDTVRADHAGFNGYKLHPTTPELDRIAENAWVFERAYAPYPTSNYSYSSTLNSLYPRATEVHGLLRKRDFKFSDEQSIAGFLGQRGWYGIGITAFNRVTSSRPEWFGTLRRGFDVFNPDQGAAQLTANQVSDSVIKTLEKTEDRPFFLFAHYLDPHLPYLKWDGFDFGDSEKERYDSEIAWCDANVGRVLQHLRSEGELKNTIIVMFSDHGEEFGEHGGSAHNHGLYEQEIHVPLFISVPGLIGRRIDAPVSLVDIVPTLLSIMGQEDTMRRHGRNLLPLMLDPDRKDYGTVFAEHYVLTGGHDEDTKRSVIHGDYKFIRRVEKRIDEIFDLSSDPLERRNLVGRGDPVEGVLRGYMKSFNDLVDRHHLAEGEELLTPEEQCRKEVFSALETFRSGSREKSRRAWVKLKNTLFDYAGNMAAQVSLSLDADALADLSRKLCDVSASTSDVSKQAAAVWLAGTLQHPAAVPYLEKQVKEKTPIALVAAIALASMGNSYGETLLEIALQLQLPLPSTVVPDKKEIAVALARLGNKAALPWIRTSMVTAEWSLVGLLARSISHLNEPSLMLTIRDLYTENHWRPVPVRQALAAYAGEFAKVDPEALWVLCLMSHDSDPVIRSPARAAAAKNGISEAVLAAAAEPAKLELSGMLAVINMKYDLAFDLYREAIEKRTWFNGALRLRFARYLHLEGHADEARSVLQEIITSAEATAHDKRIATRRIQMLSHPPRLYAPEDLKIQVESFEAPKRLSVNRSGLAKLRVKNVGDTAWQGGFWMFRIGFSVHWESEEGQPVEQRKRPQGYLPDRGLLPGESLELTVPIYPPIARDIKLRPVISFVQEWLELPDSGIIYKHKGLIQIGRDKKESPPK